MEYEIQNQFLRLAAAERGAELRRLTGQDGGEWLWDGKPQVWSGRAPVCFPWCGAMDRGRYTYGGKEYAAESRHGFARDMDHTLVDRGEDFLTFRLDWPGDDTTWPWPFRLETTHRLTGSRVQTLCAATNLSSQPMPTQLGFHPAFVCPFGPGEEVTDYRVVFQGGRVVDLEPHFFDNDSISYDDAGDFVRLERRSDGRGVEVDTRGFFRVLLWSKPGIPGFVCIEPWQGYPGPQRDPFARPGAVSLAPGETLRRTLTLTFPQT